MSDEGKRPQRITVIHAETSGERERQIEGWIGALHAAEAKAAKLANARRRPYKVNYRVKEIVSKTKGTAARRRSALVALLESLDPLEKHQSTSSWVVQLHIASAREVAHLLAPPLIKRDFLSVAEVTSNRVALGDADLD